MKQKKEMALATGIELEQRKQAKMQQLHKKQQAEILVEAGKDVYTRLQEQKSPRQNPAPIVHAQVTQSPSNIKLLTKKFLAEWN